MYFGLLFVSKLLFKVAADVISCVLFHILQEGTLKVMNVKICRNYYVGDVAAK